MESSQSKSHSFVIRVWKEDDLLERWRGHITHFPSERREYIERSEHILKFIQEYLPLGKLGKAEEE